MDQETILLAIVGVDTVIILLLVWRVFRLKKLLEQAMTGWNRTIKKLGELRDSNAELLVSSEILVSQNRRLLGYGLREASKNVKHMDTSLGS